MSSHISYAILLLIATKASGQEQESHIFRVDPPRPKYYNVPRDVEYRDYNETTFSPLSKDLTLLRSTIDAIEDRVCRRQCQLVLTNLANLTAWAVRFYDSSGKFPAGLLASPVYELGNFDECLEIGHEVEAIGNIAGQYCLSQVDVEVPETYQAQRGSVWELFKKQDRHVEPLNGLHWAACVPASCRAKDVENAIQRIIHVLFSESPLKLRVTTPERNCYTRKPLFLDAGDIVYTCVILLLLCTVVGGTIYHCLDSRNVKPAPKGKLCQILMFFSVGATIKKIFKLANDEQSDLASIAGLKAISMILILMSHSFVHVLAGPVNKRFSEWLVGRFYLGAFLNNSLFVDTFLFISGFLLCVTLLRELDKRKTLNIPLLYAFRFIRLTPTYIIMIGFYVTWITKLDMGPLWSKMENEKERCRASWWANILYINNYVNNDKICMFQSWYLCVDTQLYILAPLVIYPLWKWRNVGTSVLLGVTGISIAIPFTITLLYNLDPTLMIYPHELTDIPTNEYFKFAYIKTHMKAEAYCFGLICAYIVHLIRTSEYKLSKKTVKLGWLLGSLSLLISMYSITIFYGLRRNYTALEAAIYSSLHRVLWSIGLAWVILACVTNNAGVVKTFLEWPYFKPISKLSYGAYLIDGLVELYSVSTTHTPQYESMFTFFAISVSHVVIAYMGAALLAIISESPMLGIVRVLLHTDKKPTNQTRRNGHVTAT